MYVVALISRLCIYETTRSMQIGSLSWYLNDVYFNFHLEIIYFCEISQFRRFQENVNLIARLVSNLLSFKGKS